MKNNKGYTLMEIIVTIGIIGIVATGFVFSSKNQDIKIRNTGIELVENIENYYGKSIHTPYSYQIYLKSNEYEIKKIYRKKPSEIIKQVKLSKNIELINYPSNILLDGTKTLNIDKKKMTFKIQSTTEKKAFIYITVVPESNRLLLTKNPSKEI